jgi:hypothetical protein
MLKGADKDVEVCEIRVLHQPTRDPIEHLDRGTPRVGEKPGVVSTSGIDRNCRGPRWRKRSASADRSHSCCSDVGRNSMHALTDPKPGWVFSLGITEAPA